MKIKPEIKGALLTLFSIALLFFILWICVGLRFGLWKYIEYDRYVWLTANLPVARQLWHKEIKAGDDAEIIIKEWSPHSMRRFGPWIEMSWYPGGPSKNSISFIGINVLAKDGILVSAGSYSDDGVDARVFFDTLAPEARAEMTAALKADIEKQNAAAKPAP